ncbi:MAG: hypothetical protein LBS97_01350 [Treponema sp.]|jgi:hypothetical protein|nr:hypothetical protein [Treponema sp.]
MKKTVVLLTLAICLVSPSFAQLRMNGWGRAVWVPVFVGQDGEPRTVVQSSYGDAPDLEFMFSASSPNIGVDVGVMVTDGLFNQAANAKVWWKPNNYLKLHIGMGRVPTLRGQVAGSTGGYAYARGRLAQLTAFNGVNEPIVQIGDGDGIFSRINLMNWGAIAEITPAPGLIVLGAVAPNMTQAGLLAEDVYKGLHVAVGYEIKDVGLVRAGYIGGGKNGQEAGNAGANWDFSWDKHLEAAFALKSIPNLLLDFGVKYSLEEKPGNLSQPGFALLNPLYVALGAVYKGVPKLELGFAIDGHFLGTAEKVLSWTELVTSAPQIAFNIYPSYDLGIFTLGADITYGMQFGDVKGKNDKKMFGFGSYAQKQYGHGNIRGGVYANAPMDEGEKWGFSVPVWITYSF